MARTAGQIRAYDRKRKKRWARENPEAKRAANAAYYAKHREQILAQQKESRQKKEAASERS